jgi:phage-related protein
MRMATRTACTYTLKCPGYVYVLYCHKKKSKQGSQIPKHEEDLIFKRYRDALRDCPE